MTEDKLSIDAARSLLMGEDILPMSAVTEDLPDTATDDIESSVETAEEAQIAADVQTIAVETAVAEALEGVKANLEDTAEAVKADEAEDSNSGNIRSYGEGNVGLGVDIVEIERIKNILARRPNFADQVFSFAERAYCSKTSNPATHYALRFAAKEAVVKALGTGFSEGIWVRDIEVERAKNGRPFVRLSGRAKEVAEMQGVKEISLSMSYTHTDAVACAMAVTQAAIKASEKRKDPMEELAKQFKETRKMLDEL